jgi:glycosyltransferase involved in cell wall biosynthesis
VNFPLKVFDYLAAGKPLIATDIEGHRSVLDDELALLVPPTPDAVAAGLLELVRRPDLRERLASSAHAYALKYLSWPSFVDLVRSIYDTALSARPGRLAAEAGS